MGLGAAHAFEPDHMAAVSAFVARRPSPRQAAMFGIKWSIGHGLSLLLLGSVLFLLKVHVNEASAAPLEKVVGVVLVALGGWTLFKLRLGELHHTHAHTHRNQPPPVVAQPIAEETLADDAPLFVSPAAQHATRYIHRHADGTLHAHQRDNGSLWMGMLHGAAGTAAFVGEALVAVSQTYVTVFIYTMTFSIGVLIAMGAYAGALGGLINLAGNRFRYALLGAQALTGVAACFVGACWIIGIELPGLFSH